MAGGWSHNITDCASATGLQSTNRIPEVVIRLSRLIEELTAVSTKKRVVADPQWAAGAFVEMEGRGLSGQQIKTASREVVGGSVGTT